jgi:hypothetical protein
MPDLTLVRGEGDGERFGPPEAGTFPSVVAALRGSILMMERCDQPIPDEMARAAGYRQRRPDLTLLTQADHGA